MSEESLREFITSISKAVGDSFSKFGRIMPHAILHTKEDDLEIVELQAPKQAVAELLRFMMSQGNIKRYVFVDEAWMLMINKPELTTEEKRKYMMEGAAAQPGRVEVIYYQAEDEMVQVVGRQEIFRETDGAPRLGILELVVPNKSEGRMSGLMPRKGPMQ